MSNFSMSWQFWAFSAAVFAALTAIFAKISVENISPDYAAFLFIMVIIIVPGGILFFTNQHQSVANFSRETRAFLTLSGVATVGSWVCYFLALKIGSASQIASIDKLSVVFVAIIGVIFLSSTYLLGVEWALV